MISGNDSGINTGNVTIIMAHSKRKVNWQSRGITQPLEMDILPQRCRYLPRTIDILAVRVLHKY